MLINDPFGTSGGGGGGGTNPPTVIVNNLNSTSTTSALGAGQGKILKEMQDTHASKVATTSELGHVKFDGDTIKINPQGQLYTEAKPIKEDSKLVKHVFKLTPTEVGQTDFDIPLEGFLPEKYVDLLFRNSTKVPAKDYIIVAKNPLEVSEGFKLVLNNPITSLSNLIDLTLMSGSVDGKDIAGLTKIEYSINSNASNPAEIDIPFTAYSPEHYMDLIFRNSTKMPTGDYSIQLKNPSNPASGYKVVILRNPPTTPTAAIFNLVFITNKISSGIADSAYRFYEGANPPSDTSLIWIKTT